LDFPKYRQDTARRATKIQRKRKEAHSSGVEFALTSARTPLEAERTAMSGRNGLTAEMRERLERIVIQLLEIATRREIDPALQDELMRLANQISALIEDDG
jgi:hypothetical protein